MLRGYIISYTKGALRDFGPDCYRLSHSNALSEACMLDLTLAIRTCGFCERSTCAGAVFPMCIHAASMLYCAKHLYFCDVKHDKGSKNNVADFVKTSSFKSKKLVLR